MAYDPEARQQSNSAMIIGVVALVLLVIGALAYYSTQNSQAEQVAVTPPVVTHTERTEVVPVPGNPPAPVVIDRPVPVVVPGTTVTTPSTTRIIERDTHTSVTHDRVPTPPASSAPSRTTNNVTVNVPREPSRTTSQATTGTGTSGTDTGTDAGTSTTTSSTTTDSTGTQ